jgi:N6-L-threonylcarbamoyladenine synthase
VAASFQQAVLAVLDDRVARGLAAVRALAPVTAMAVAGGVAANQAIGARLRSMAEREGLPLVVAPPALCTDNAVMIAWAGAERYAMGRFDGLDTEPRARWPLAELT